MKRPAERYLHHTVRGSFTLYLPALMPVQAIGYITKTSLDQSIVCGIFSSMRSEALGPFGTDTLEELFAASW